MEETLAVLIDFENIAAGTEKDGLGRFDVHAVMARVKDKGRILVARSYADWGRFARFKQDLLRANVTMYELTSHGMQDKNRADIAMVVDCLELALTRDYISTYVIVSGDSDFTPLAQKLREHNKRVIGCGCRSSTSRLLIDACDEFFFYDNIATDRRRPAPERGRGNRRMTREAAFELAAATIQGLQRENPDPPLASVVKGAMLRRSPDFSESDLRFSSFARFLEAAQDAGRLNVVRDPKSGGYRVDLVEAEGSARVETSDAEPKSVAPVGGPYIDAYMPEAAHETAKLLASRGFDPLSAPTRRTLLETLEAVVEDRRKRRRRVTAKFVQEDVRKRLRRTHPDLPKESVNGVFDALLKASVLMHRDGTPIRTFQAPFMLDRNAEKLNEAAMGIYLSELRDAGVKLAPASVLAELFLGNAERARDVEEALAWLAAPPLERDDDDRRDVSSASMDDLDLDDLLSFDETEERPLPDAAAAASDLDKILEISLDDDSLFSEEDSAPVEEKPKPKKRTRAKKKVETTSDDDLLLEEAPAAAEAKPAAVEEAPAAVEEAPAAVEEAPAAVEEAPATEAVAEEAPKREPRRRRTTKKKTEDEA